MLNSKQRNYLRSLATNEPDIIHIGKEGITPQVVVQVRDALKARELIKGKVQQTAMIDVKEAAEELSKSTQSQVVCTIGNKFVLFKMRHMDSAIKFPK
jgi:RNA-binding protein